MFRRPVLYWNKENYIIIHLLTTSNIALIQQKWPKLYQLQTQPIQKNKYDNSQTFVFQLSPFYMDFHFLEVF